MHHIDLATREEAIKEFFMALPSDPEGSVVELNGKPVARITPVNGIASEKWQDGTAWTNLKNARRCELVDLSPIGLSSSRVSPKCVRLLVAVLG